MTLRSSRIALVALAIIAPLIPALAFQPGGTGEKPALDVRLPATYAARAGWVMRAPTPVQLATADALRAAAPDLSLHWDGMSGSPAWIAAPPGLALSAPYPGTPDEAARTFLRANASLFGLTPREVDQLRHASTIPARMAGRTSTTRRRSPVSTSSAQSSASLSDRTMRRSVPAAASTANSPSASRRR